MASNPGEVIDAYMQPLKWPAWLRRTFLLTLPISGLIWALGACVITIVMALVAAIGLTVFWLASLWCGRNLLDD